MGFDGESGEWIGLVAGLVASALEPELAMLVQGSGIAGAVPGLLRAVVADAKLGFFVAPPVEIAREDVVAVDDDFADGVCRKGEIVEFGRGERAEGAAPAFWIEDAQLDFGTGVPASKPGRFSVMVVG